MDTELCISRIRNSSETMLSLYTPDTAELPVPACPAWTLRDLLLHLADVHHFWALTILEADPSRELPFEAAYPEGADVIEWARSCTDELVVALRAKPFDSPCQVWWEEPAIAGAVGEHQVYEAALHCWDAQGAVMTPPAIDRDICVAGIPEWIDVRKSWMTEMPLPHITFETTDAPGSWSLGGQSAGAVTIRGTASDVYLYMNGRLGVDALTVTGDVEALEAFTERMEYLNG
jgi:uncharacterized protein (TIGR03083 family)